MLQVQVWMSTGGLFGAYHIWKWYFCESQPAFLSFLVIIFLIQDKLNCFHWWIFFSIKSSGYSSLSIFFIFFLFMLKYLLGEGHISIMLPCHDLGWLYPLGLGYPLRSLVHGISRLYLFPHKCSRTCWTVQFEVVLIWMNQQSFSSCSPNLRKNVWSILLTSQNICKHSYLELASC